MQLTGPEILRRMRQENPNNPGAKPDIIITPFDNQCMGSNSYDLHLGNQLKIYTKTLPYGMLPAIEYHRGRIYSMRDWFWDYSAYLEYRKYPEKYDPRNPRFLLDPCDSESHKTTDIEIPRDGLILSPDIGYLGHTVEYTETYNLFSIYRWQIISRTQFYIESSYSRPWRRRLLWAMDTGNQGFISHSCVS